MVMAMVGGDGDGDGHDNWGTTHLVRLKNSDCCVSACMSNITALPADW